MVLPSDSRQTTSTVVVLRVHLPLIAIFSCVFGKSFPLELMKLWSMAEGGTRERESPIDRRPAIYTKMWRKACLLDVSYGWKKLSPTKSFSHFAIPVLRFPDDILSSFFIGSQNIAPYTAP